MNSLLNNSRLEEKELKIKNHTYYILNFLISFKPVKYIVYDISLTLY